jgi:hypothetical protein
LSIRPDRLFRPRRNMEVERVSTARLIGQSFSDMGRL